MAQFPTLRSQVEFHALLVLSRHLPERGALFGLRYDIWILRLPFLCWIVMTRFQTMVAVSCVALVTVCTMLGRKQPEPKRARSQPRLVSSKRGPSRFDLKLTKNETVVFLGGTNAVRMQQAGYLESVLAIKFAKQSPKFRDLAWEADTVFGLGTAIERWRRDGFGGRDRQFKLVGATTVLAQFGQMESMAGPDGVRRFERAYEKLIDGIQQQTKKVVLISPFPFEKPTSSLVPDVSQHNASLKLYVEAIRRIALRRGLGFVDLFSEPRGRLTENGIHVTAQNQIRYALTLAQGLGVRPNELRNRFELQRVRVAVREKCRLWYDYWRPANWKLLYGDDSRRIFTRGGKNYPPFRVEWMRLKGLVAKADQRVWQVAQGGKDPGHARPKAEVLHGAPGANIKKELASFQVLDGLKVNLFASEKHGITSPLAIRWDPAGRMYVTISTTYPHVFPGDVPNDKIIVLEDTNRDGVADKSTVFAEGLNIPTGLELGDGGVYVGQATEILFLKDTDGDLKADVRKVLLSGFGNGDSHQTINSFIWSPDGELYFGQGDGCESRVETPWGNSKLFQAGFYRLRPGRLQLDPLLDDFMGPGNPWGVAFDSWGQIFSIDGAGGVTFLSPGQIPVHHRQRLKRIGKPGGYCGIGYLDGVHLPVSLRGDFVIGDFKPNRIKRFSVKQKGGGYELQWKKPLLTSKHRNFRPVDVKVGPDGAIYIVDWYNPITCHQDDSYRVPTRDKAHGRIWRVSSSEKPHFEYPPNLVKASLADLVQQLKSPEYWTRYQVKRMLTQHSRAKAAQALRKFVKELDPRSAQLQRHRFEALSAFATIEVVAPQLLQQVLASADYRARAFATRLVGRWHDRLADPLELLEARVQDRHALVRMEAVVACAAVPQVRSIELAARVVDQSMDYWLDYVFTQAVHQLEPHWLPAFQRGASEFARPQQMAAILSKSSGRKVLPSLKRLARSRRLNESTRLAAMKAVIAVGSPEDFQDWVLDRESYIAVGEYRPAFHAKVLAGYVERVERSGIRPTKQQSNVLPQLLAANDSGLRKAAMKLAAIWDAKRLQAAITKIATAKSTGLTERAEAFAAMAKLRTPVAKSILKRHAAAGQSLPIRAAAIRSLVYLDLQLAAAETVILLENKVDSPIVASVLQGFLDQRDGAKVLGKRIGKSKLSKTVSEDVLAALYAAGRSDVSLVKPLNRAIGLTGKAPKFSQGYLAAVVKEARRKGNAKRGETIFRSTKASCLKCHTVGSQGGVVGPNLTAIGTTLSAERITEELLWPQRQVKEGYTMLQIVTDDGKIHQGYQRTTRESRKTGDIVLRELNKNRFYTIAKDDVEAQRIVGSAMPQGIPSGLTQSELLDLIQYLVGLGRKEK